MLHTFGNTVNLVPRYEVNIYTHNVKMKKISAWTWLYIAWALALIGMLGSLYASEVVGLIPCVLCWYQRIALYPLVAILAIGIWRKDSHVYVYVWPLVAVGAAFAAYHTLLQWRVIPEAVAPCINGISCVTAQFSLFGFVNFPLLSFLAFSIIGICLYLFQRNNTTG